jgi:hypothetical protein
VFTHNFYINMNSYHFFFGPHKRYAELPFNQNPQIECLLSSSINPQVYPLRSIIKNSGIGGLVYRNATYALGDAYARLLNSYFCCVATSSIFNYAVAKYFEIPASGSLLLANEVDDLRRAGFVVNKHYIPITKTNMLNKITHCLKNPIEYDNIRKEAMKFVRENHSVINRIDRIKIILNEVINR